ncbi:MAG: glycosyltransferase [Chloroflexi bacterium]|nr:glycosyltransferase [Chloroflexota bacterium]
MFNQILLASDLKARFNIRHLDTTRTDAGAGKAGTLALINFVYLFKQILQLLSILIFYRPHIMHLPITDRIAFWKEGMFMLVARLFGVRVVGHLHGCMFKELIEHGNWLTRRGVAYVLALPTVIIALSEGWRTFLVERINPRLNVVVVPNTVDDDFARLAHQQRPGRSPEGVKVLFVGSLLIRKGILDALGAVHEVLDAFPATQFVFAGGIKSEAERAEIERACATVRTNGQVHFPGIVTGADKLRLFEEADIFILPAYHENFPIVVLEAMAASLPLVVTPVGALPEVLREGENCFFVDPGNPAQLADRVQNLIADRNLRRRMGTANGELFRREFDQPAILQKIEQVYRSLFPTPATGTLSGMAATAANEIELSYPPISTRYTGPIPEHWGQDLLAVLPPGALGSLCLDFGCGDGRSRTLIERFGYRWIGLDICGADARVCGDGHRLPFANQTFDLVISNAVFEHLRDPFVAAIEIHRVLKPGGTLLGEAAFLEPEHAHSYFHMSWYGVLEVLSRPGFDVLRLWPTWHAFEAQAHGLVPISRLDPLIRWSARGIARIIMGIRALALGSILRARGHDRQAVKAYLARENLRFAGSVAFLARRN